MENEIKAKNRPKDRGHLTFMSISVAIPKSKGGHCRKVRGVVETVTSSEEVWTFFCNEVRSSILCHISRAENGPAFYLRKLLFVG